MQAHRYFLVYKPRKMVAQFVSSHKVKLLGDLDFDFPEGTHAIGRLDNNSEGLLLLTTNRKVTRLLFEDTGPHARTYVLLVQGLVTPEKVRQLEAGVPISDPRWGTYTTLPCTAAIIPKPEGLYNDRFIYRERGDNTWLQLSLTEGRYHQVRKMVDAIGHQCKRLIRTAIEDHTIGTLQPGEVQEIDELSFFRGLRIEEW
ncbi:MAG: pseudouridine synthase [Chitinophagia bacterium]|nr:pseudouridine synthase [Chitinophagia bacterium]